MRRLIYSMGVSVDGFVNGPDGEIGFSVDEELHRFHNDEARRTGVHLYGRGLYETMTYWESAAERHPDSSEHELEFAEIWKRTPKLVFSRTLASVEGNATLVREDVIEEVRRLKREPGVELAVGGPGLAATLIEAGLVDEYRLFVHPVVHGGGTPFFPPLRERIELEPIDERSFGSGVVLRSYRPRSSPA